MILSTYPTALPTTLNWPGYEFLSGTSMSTPMVAGAAALALAANGGKDSIKPTKLRKLLLASVDQVPALQGKVSSGVSLSTNMCRLETAFSFTILTFSAWPFVQGRLNLENLLQLVAPDPCKGVVCGSPGTCEVAPGTCRARKCYYPAAPAGTSCPGGTCNGNRQCGKPSPAFELEVYCPSTRRSALKIMPTCMGVSICLLACLLG